MLVAIAIKSLRRWSCATDPNVCRKEYGDIPENSMLIRDAIDRVRGDSDIPWQMNADVRRLLVNSEGRE